MGNQIDVTKMSLEELAFLSHKDTMIHRHRLLGLGRISIIMPLLERFIIHDESKLHDPEIDTFAKLIKTPLNTYEYMSTEYKAALSELGETLTHHYENNRHHPEYHKNGISDMNILDLIEMLLDWKVSGRRTVNGDLFNSIRLNTERFKISEDMVKLLMNTAPILYSMNIEIDIPNMDRIIICADSYKELQLNIDNYSFDNVSEIGNITEFKDLLKYGYENEFKQKYIHSTEHFTDTGVNVNWVIRNHGSYCPNEGPDKKIE